MKLQFQNEELNCIKHEIIFLGSFEHNSYLWYRNFVNKQRVYR